MVRKSFTDRYLEKISVIPGDSCIYWKGRIDRLGYPRITYKGKEAYVHKVLYENCYGSVKRGYDVHHVCGNKGCVNLAHLRVVSHSDHMINHSPGVSAENAKKTHCPRGHELKEPNLRKTKRGRECLACRQINDEAARRRAGMKPRGWVNLTLNGETHSQKEWAKILGLNDATILYRIRSGRPIEEALSREKFKPGGKTRCDPSGNM
jgi:hypothetical protein